MDYRAFDGVRPNDASTSPVRLVLDGLQRLTALYQVCLSQEAVRIKAEKGFEYRRYYFDMEKAADAIAPLEHAIFSVSLREGRFPIVGLAADYTDLSVQAAHGIFPANMIFDFRTYERRYLAFWDELERRPSREDAIRILCDFRSAIVDTFQTYKVPVQTIREHVSRGEIMHIFEKINVAA
jgi:hypothetical protein